MLMGKTHLKAVIFHDFERARWWTGGTWLMVMLDSLC